MRFSSAAFRRRVEAGIIAVGTLWVVSVTAGSETAAAAATALKDSVPLYALKWELGDFWVEDELSPAAVMALGESPLLLSARSAVAEIRMETEVREPPPEAEEEVITVPVEETPLDAPSAEENGVEAKTLIPTDPSGYMVCGRAYISNSTDHELSIQDLQAGFSAELTSEEPQILILHTHGSEAYTPADAEEIVWSGEYRTTDSRYNVVKVGMRWRRFSVRPGFLCFMTGPCMTILPIREHMTAPSRQSRAI